MYRSVESVEKTKVASVPSAVFRTVEAFALPLSVLGDETVEYVKPVVL